MNDTVMAGVVVETITEAYAASATAVSMLDIVEAALHSRTTEWLFLRELRIGTGHWAMLVLQPMSLFI